MPGVSDDTLAITPKNYGVNKLWITAEESQKPEEVKIEG